MTEAMTDRELLRLAAKAYGFTQIKWVDWKGGMGCECFTGFLVGENLRYWNPLNDDGDALRLAVEVGAINIDIAQTRTSVLHKLPQHIEDHGSDPLAATRRAIVRAAAEIGRSMP